MTTVVTGWSPQGWKLYGLRFLESFHRYWPREVSLKIYVEQLFNHPILNLKTDYRKIELVKLDVIPGCMEFINKYANDKRANGREVRPEWKEKCRKEGYNFRFDAWKFCRQGFIPYHAACELSMGYMCWLDGDVVTTAAPPIRFLERLLPPDKHVAYLGRGSKHSEIGFQLYRIPEALPVLRTFYDLYASEHVFDLKEWHSAYCFDIARKSNVVASLDLTPGGFGNVWQQSALAAFSDHLKGKRKGYRT